MNKNPERLFNISNSQLSIARYSGGCIFNGARYVYIAEDDVLVRSDIFDLDRKAQKKFTTAEKMKWEELKKQAEENMKQDWMCF